MERWLIKGLSQRHHQQAAARIRRTVDELAAAQDLEGVVEELRRMDEYLRALSDDERQTFASYWTNPSLQDWLNQTMETLQRDAARRIEAGEQVGMPGAHRNRRPPRQ